MPIPKEINTIDQLNEFPPKNNGLLRGYIELEPGKTKDGYVLYTEDFNTIGMEHNPGHDSLLGKSIDAALNQALTDMKMRD